MCLIPSVMDFSFKCGLLLFPGFPCGSTGKESACSVGDLGLMPGLGRSPGEWKGYTLQYSGLENSMDCIIHGVVNSHVQLSNFHFLRKSKIDSVSSRSRLNHEEIKHLNKPVTSMKVELVILKTSQIEKLRMGWFH